MLWMSGEPTSVNSPERIKSVAITEVTSSAFSGSVGGTAKTEGSASGIGWN